MVLEYGIDCSKPESGGRDTSCETTTMVQTRCGTPSRMVEMKVEIRRHLEIKLTRPGFKKKKIRAGSEWYMQGILGVDVIIPFLFFSFFFNFLAVSYFMWNLCSLTRD